MPKLAFDKGTNTEKCEEKYFKVTKSEEWCIPQTNPHTTLIDMKEEKYSEVHQKEEHNISTSGSDAIGHTNTEEKHFELPHSEKSTMHIPTSDKSTCTGTDEEKYSEKLQSEKDSVQKQTSEIPACKAEDKVWNTWALESGILKCVKHEDKSIERQFDSYLKETPLKSDLKRVTGKTDGKKYQCNKCNKYLTRIGLQHHYRKFKEHASIFPCQMCRKVFKSSVFLEKHMAKEHCMSSKRQVEEVPKLQCDKCQMEFGSTNALQEHSRIHLREKPFKCDVCDKAFKLGSTLDAHMEIHADVKPHKCSVCHKRFRDINEMIEHKKQHEECKICHKTFEKSEELQLHKRKHMEDEKSMINTNEEWDELEETVDGNEGLINNELTTDEEEDNQADETDENTSGSDVYRPDETDENTSDSDEIDEYISDNDELYHPRRRYKQTKSGDKKKPKQGQCDVCGVIVRRFSSLKVHMRLHTNEKPYVCDICSKAFRSKGLLNVHVTTHSDKRPYVCEICGAAFKTTSILTRHSRIHTKDKPFKCPTCNRSFNATCKLVRHVKIHSGIKPYECNVCQQTFQRSYTLQQHLRLHTGEKPYECKACGVRFAQLNSLNVHKQTYHERKKSKPVKQKLTRVNSRTQKQAGEQCQTEVTEKSSEDLSNA